MPANKPAVRLLCGVDYGAQLAGTTVFCILKEGRITIETSARKQAADAWLEKTLGQLPPALIGFDAPLSLPGVYRNLPSYYDYFYRTADREVGAMSPLFLGGLTARVMRLSRLPVLAPHQFVEVYPGGLIRHLNNAPAGYKKSGKVPSEWHAWLENLLNAQLIQPPQTWHQVDACLALCSAQRVSAGKAVVVGDAVEGQIAI